MKKSLLIFCIALFFNQVAAQKTSAKITYTIANIDFVDTGKNVDVTKMLATAKKQQYQLVFNNQKTYFKQLDLVQDESFSEFYNSLAKIYVSNSDYYFDYVNDDLIEIIRDGTLLESKIQKLPWQITSESKMIDQYQCFKATYTFDYMARDNKMKTRAITAWFAPSLPYSYGPKNYHGLPGLILELTDRTTTFLASKIELLDKPIEIKIPSGKRINKEQFEKAILKN